MKKLAFLFFILFFSSVFSSSNIVSVSIPPPATSSSCDSSMKVDYYEKIQIVGDVYNVERTLNVLPPLDENHFCLSWFLDQNPTDIWNIENYFNGKKVSETLAPTDAVWRRVFVQPKIVDWVQRPDSNGYYSQYPLCFDINQNGLNEIFQTFTAVNRVKKGVWNPITGGVAGEFDPDFWFPFDARILTESPQPDTNQGGKSIRYSTVIEFPVDFVDFGSATVNGEVVQKKLLVFADSKGQPFLELPLDIHSDTNNSINFYRSNNSKEPNYAIIGPICGTSSNTQKFTITLIRGPFIFAVFWLAVLFAFVIFLLWFFKKVGTKDALSNLLLVFIFQEGITQFSPVTRPLQITIFDIVLPIGAGLILLLWTIFLLNTGNKKVTAKEQKTAKTRKRKNRESKRKRLNPFSKV